MESRQSGIVRHFHSHCLSAQSLRSGTFLVHTSSARIGQLRDRDWFHHERFEELFASDHMFCRVLPAYTMCGKAWSTHL